MQRGSSEPYQRFVREIKFLHDHQDIPGLLPLLNAHLPDQPDKTYQPWLAMPIATPTAQALEGRPLADVVAAAAAVAIRKFYPLPLRPG